MALLKIVIFSYGSILMGLMVLDFIIGRNKNPIIYPSFIFYFFMYVPILLDLIIGRPNYSSLFHGFLVSHSEPLVELIYLISILYISSNFFFFQKRKYENTSFSVHQQLSTAVFVCSIFLMLYKIIPLLRNKELMEVILSYSVFENHNPIFQKIGFYGHYIILLSVFNLFIEKRRKLFFLKLLCLLPFIYLGMLINGKRNIVFLFIISLNFILIINTVFKHRISYFIVIIFSIVFLMSFSRNYQIRFNRLSSDDFITKYTSYRINYGRDDTFKTSLYSIIKDNKNILNYSGESFLFYPTFFIRRSSWPNKPYPFAVYFTSYLLDLSSSIPLGWGMTTSIFDEFIANLGLIGIIISPFFFRKISNMAMKYNQGIIGAFIQILAILAMVLSIAVEVTAFLSLYISLLLMVLIYKIIYNKKSYP